MTVAPVDRVIPFNGAQSKFVVLRMRPGLYFSISNLSVIPEIPSHGTRWP